MVTTIVHTVATVTTCHAAACAASHSPDATSLVTAGAAVVQALGAVIAIIATVILARGSAEREAAADASAGERERAADAAAERRANEADTAAEDRRKRDIVEAREERHQEEVQAFNTRLDEVTSVAGMAIALLDDASLYWKDKADAEAQPNYTGSAIHDPSAFRVYLSAIEDESILGGRASPQALAIVHLHKILSEGLGSFTGRASAHLERIAALRERWINAVREVRAFRR